jgi:SAM-dependent methyltransferase
MSATYAQIVELATAPYQQSGKFAWHFAKGKLGGDPAFAGLLRLGLLKDNDRVLDIGCGQGLLAACLLAAEARAQAAQWPQGWAPAPKGLHIHGVELMQKDVDRARAAHKGDESRVTFECADMCQAQFAPCDAVVILDVLHYVPIEAQDDVLARIVTALKVRRNTAVPGRLLLRVGDASAGLPFKISNWVDHVVTFIRGHRLSTLYCRSVADWTSHLQSIGFRVKPVPMHEGTPFANILLQCELDEVQVINQ